MRFVNPSEAIFTELCLEFGDGSIDKFYFIHQLIPQVNGEVNFSANGIFLAIDYSTELIKAAKRQHKAVRHYYEHLAELIRLTEMLLVLETEGADSEELDLRELELAA